MISIKCLSRYKNTFKRSKMHCLAGVFFVGVAAFVCEEGKLKKNNDLVQAVFRDDVSLIKSILLKNPDPNVINEEGDTPLHQLFQSGNDVARHIKEILQLLLDNFVDVTMPNKQGEEPFVYVDRISSSIPKKLSFAGIMVLHGASMDTRSSVNITNGSSVTTATLFDLVVQTGGTPGAEAFLAWWGWLVLPETLQSAKNVAALLKYTDIVTVLEKKDVFITEHHVDTLDPEWRHPHTGLDLLSMLVLKKDIPLIRRLLSRKTRTFDINQKTESLFSKAIDNTYTPSDTEVFDFSQTGVASFSGGIKFGYTPLHLAILQRDLSMVQFLIDQGAKTTIIADNGNTPLHCIMYINPLYSSANNDLILRLAQILLRNGADINAKNKKGETLFHIILQRDAKNLFVPLWSQYKQKLSQNIKKSILQKANSCHHIKNYLVSTGELIRK